MPEIYTPHKELSLDVECPRIVHTGQGLAFTKMMFSSVMPRERFQPIMRFLHFGDEPQQPDDRLAKVRFLINHLNNTMPEIYTPYKELSLDESMMLWRGRLVFRQYIKNIHKYGVKFFELCTDDGLVFKIEMYSGTKFTDTESLGQTGSIV